MTDKTDTNEALLPPCLTETVDNVQCRHFPGSYEKCYSCGVMKTRHHPEKDKELTDRLQPYAQGCFSGRVSEWPGLKPLLAEIYQHLKGEKK